MIRANRNAHFELGHSSSKAAKISNKTSANDAYSPGKLEQKPKSDAKSPQTHRIANFKMGFEKNVSYITTSDQNNKYFHEEGSNEQVSKTRQSQILAQKDRITSNRVPHYDFGRHTVNYQTSNKGQFTRHDLSQASQSKITAA